MSRLRLAVVGVGALGRHHARILSEHPEVELVAVSDNRQAQGEEVASKCRTKWVADYRDLLDRSRIDAVSVVVPTIGHREVAGAFLDAGISVLVEKPLAANAKQAQELVDIAVRNKVLLQVGHIERFNPAFQVARPLISNPKYIRTERTSGYPFRSTDIGVVHDLMIHDIDLILSLAKSRVRSVEAFGVTVVGGHEDVANARLRFENGCIADLMSSRFHPTVSRSLQAWSAEGCVTCDLHHRDVRHYCRSEELINGPSPLELARRPDSDIEQLKREMFGRFVTVNSIPVPADGPDALTQELSEFVRSIQTGASVQVDGHQALSAMQVAEQVLSSIATHEWNGSHLKVADFDQARKAA
ncbi:MAG: Gfo/Idh/MocA family oxidoreductase [Planctomycetes bacterium]|nr:Gfo/Idh/MocA family oxidoreductase [Planctomycetota bacterium]